MQTISAFFSNFFNPLFSQPAILLGLVSLIGLIALKKPFQEVISGTVKTAVGVLLLQTGAGMMTTTFQPIIYAFSERFSIQGVIIDPYITLSAVSDSLGNKLGWVGFTMMVGFFVNLLLVSLNRLTKIRSIFLTGHVMFLQSALVTWILTYYFELNFIWTVSIAGLLAGLYWSIGAEMNAKPTAQITNDAGFTIAHQQHLMNWAAWKFGPLLGKPKDSIENFNLPDWLEEFKDASVSVPIVMSLFFTPILLLLGPEKITEISGLDSWYLYLPLVALSFGSFMAIINLGVSMFVGELSKAFKGISEKILPNSIIGVDGMAIAPYSPKAVVAGFLVCAIGQLTGIVILIITGSPILIIPGFIPVFFDAAITAVFANHFGGWKSLVIISFFVGLIHIFGSAWAASLSGLQGGWMGTTDWGTFWPLVMEVMKSISGK